jgi:alkylation response protein AidB-like acyl-CoA dehydrogenase
VTNERIAAPVFAAERLRDRIREVAAEIEQERRVPQALVDEMRAAGLFHLGLPRSLGGLEVDPVTAGRSIEELAYADGSVGWVAMIAAQSAWFASFMPDEDTAAIWGGGGIVAGTARPIGRAVATDRPEPGYVVSGRWPFASGSTHATWFMGECVVYDGDEPRRTPAGDEVTRAVLVPRKQVAIHDTWHTTGLRGTASNDFSVDAAFVPASRGFQMLVTPPVHAWWPRGSEPLVFMNHGTHALGVARAALDAAKETMREKRGWGNQPLSSIPRMQMTLAEATTLVQSASAYLYASADALWSAVQDGSGGTPELRARVRLATSHAAKASVEAVDRVHAALATSSVFTASALERRFRDIHTAAAHVMIGPMTFEAAGRVELGLEPAFPFF